MHVSYDIFSGFLDQGAIWLATTAGLAVAKEHMEEFAATRPVPYFVFDCQNHEMVASIRGAGQA
jgi:hypothetical protein